VKKTKLVQFSIRIDPAIIKRLDEIAEKTHRNRTGIIGHMLGKGIQEYNNFELFQEKTK